MSKIKERVIVALIFIPLFLFLIFVGGVGFLGFITLVIGFSLFEFYRCLGTKEGFLPLFWWGLLGGILLPVLGYFGGEEGLLWALIGVILFTLFLQFLLRRVHQSIPEIPYTLGGIFYVSLLLSFILLLRKEGGRGLTYALFFITWMGDSGAYFSGEVVGKHKLFPTLSPSKSWEGLLGGIGFSLLATFLSSLWLPFSFLRLLLLGFILGVAGEIGDWVGSMWKRSGGVKDFGKTLPGHGGVLDRFDSLCFSAPIFYYYFKWFLR